MRFLTAIFFIFSNLRIKLRILCITEKRPNLSHIS